MKRALWVGRNQPFHLGHLLVLQRGLAEFPLPTVIGLVCQDLVPNLRDAAGKHNRTRNFLTPWERLRIVEMCLEAEGLSRSVNAVFVPRSDGATGVFRSFVPPDCIRLTTNKDLADSAKVDFWRSQGFEAALIDVRGLEIISASHIREVMRQGGDWRPFLHEASHEYFVEIEGPERMRGSLRGDPK